MPRAGKVVFMINSQNLRDRSRELTRQTILDAAERLLDREDVEDFSMRELAVEAGVGFATPFNNFGNKNSIMQALSARVIDRMSERFKASDRHDDAISDVLGMVGIAVDQLLKEPRTYRRVIGSLSVVGDITPEVQSRSRALWAQALGNFEGLEPDLIVVARRELAEQLAFMFRGCLSFWISGEVADSLLLKKVRLAMASVLLGFAAPTPRRRLIEMLSDFGQDQNVSTSGRR